MRNFLFFMVFISLLGVGCTGGVVDRSSAVARVNDRAISIASLEAALVRLAHQPGKDFTSASGRKDLLKELVDEELLFQEAMKARLIEKSDRLHREIAKEYLVTQIGQERYEPSDEEVAKYYESKKGELEKVRASHILIQPAKPGDQASEAQAKAKADSILAMIRKEGSKADFAKHAIQYSQDSGTKGQGGDLNFFVRGQMVKEFADAAFALKNVGDLSPVVKSQFGYHIIKLTGAQRGLDYLRPSIKSAISLEKQKVKADHLLEELRMKAKVEIFDDNVAKAKAPTSPLSGEETKP
jgi:hypothetical protein